MTDENIPYIIMTGHTITGRHNNKETPNTGITEINLSEINLDAASDTMKTGKEGLQCTAVLHIVLLILYRQVTAVVRERTSGDRGEIVQ
jgi:hypothetical protein